jgi:carbamoyltransferase
VSPRRYVLGINKYDHDVSAVLLRDGLPVAGIPKERITREKNAAGAPDVAIGYCLKAAGIRLDDVDLVVQNCYALSVPEMERDLLSRVHDLHLPAEERDMALASPLFMNPDAVTISHHLAHAYSAFAASPFEEGAVMVVDGVGSHRRDAGDPVPGEPPGHPSDRESESYYVFRGTELTPVHKEWLPVTPGVLSEDFTKQPGLGAVYSRVSEYVFAHWNKCGEVMGLAAFGKERADLPPLVGVRDGATWALLMWPEWLRNPWIPPEDAEGNRKDERRLWERSPHQEEWRDLCWRVQTDLEETLLARARALHEETGMKDLVISGGVALNCVANARIATETPFERVWVQPAAGDTGIALGCALYGEVAHLGEPRRYVMGTDGLGITYGDEEIDAALRTPPFGPFLRVRRARDVAAETARELANGKVVGWMQAGAEFGPRALGQRSILCDPRDPRSKERLNARVKHRQAFRPFAPAVLEEKVDEWFEPGPMSTHMLFIRDLRADRKDAIPAVVHVDGTARLQTVSAEQRPEFHALISAFERETGVPIVVNTSFNVRGEPIVETPEDALLCFLGTDMDVLVVGDRIVEKRLLFPLLRRLLLELYANKQKTAEEAARSILSRYRDR